jgi:hypothetical protein
MKTEEVTVLGLKDVFFGFVAEHGAHVYKVGAFLQSVCEGLRLWLGEVRVP